MLAGAVGVESKKVTLFRSQSAPWISNFLPNLRGVWMIPNCRMFELMREGVPIGWQQRLPRTSAICDRKTRWRSHVGEEGDNEGWKANYRSAVEHRGEIEKTFLEQEACADNSVETYTDLFTIAVRNGDIQEFDSKWDGTKLSMTKIQPEDILETIVQIKNTRVW